MSLTANRHRKRTAQPPAKKEVTRPSKPRSNLLHGISLGRRYCEFKAPQEREELFRTRNTAKAISDEGNQDSILPTSELLNHLNSTVIERIFGNQLKPEVVRMLLNGIADQVLVLVEKGYKVRIPNLMVAGIRTLNAKKGRNPQTGEVIDLGKRSVIQIQPTYSAKLYFKKGSEE